MSTTVNSTKRIQLRQKVAKLPRTPGVYTFKNSKNKILYIGKAKNLRNRVKSYFQPNLDPVSKTATLVKQIANVEVTETLSELEALILEAQLIKTHKPKYNIALKDDKSYLYIVIRREKLLLSNRNAAKESAGPKSTTLPKVITARETDLLPKDIAFGPYPSAYIAKHIVRIIRKALPYRDCSKSKFNRYNKVNQPCLYGHIGLCQAPCTDKITVAAYKKDITRIKSLLSGKSNSLIKSLTKAMLTAAKAQDFEAAAKYRDTLKKFEYIRQKSYMANKYIDNPYLVQDLRDKSLKELKNNISILHKIPHRIECYDISNISGTDATGSMVVAIDGEIKKSEYRRFKIRRKDSPDDFDMMNEVLKRRIKRDWPRPDLIIVDGGKGQVSAGLAALGVEAMIGDVVSERLPIALIGLAKKHETIVFFDQSVPNAEFIEINLPKDNEGLKLLQRLRDESHRFAQSYHHKLRLKRLKLST